MKKRILSILLCGFLLISLTGCGNNGLTNKDVIGTWVIENDTRYNMEKIMLYEGGTGKGIEIEEDEKNPSGWYPIEWEIKDGVLNIKASNLPSEGYKLENDKLITVDGKYTYTKEK